MGPLTTGNGADTSWDLYPTAEDLTYIATVRGQRTVFMTNDAYSRAWFYPRYRGGKLHEPMASEALVKSLTPQSVFVDVGGHLGYFSMIAAHSARAVFTIEPQESLITRIHRNAAANHFGNVNTIMAAAGNETGFVTIPKAGNASTSVTVGGAGNLVPMIRLDDYFTGDLMPTHIKIDTEGFEYQVLQGAAAILKSRPMLFIEIHRSMHKFGHSVRELLDFLRDHGYQMTAMWHRATLHENATKDLAAMADQTDFMILCRPT